MKNKLEIMRLRLQEHLNPTYLEVLDESEQHKGHAGYQGGGRHFAIIITADCLEGLTRVKAHQKIYALFTDLMPDEIHALRIQIK